MAEITGETTEKKTKKDKAYIIFTKAPERGKVKTRMKPFYDDDQCIELQKALIRDGLRRAGRLRGKGVALFFAWSGGTSQLRGLEAMAEEAGVEMDFFSQRGDGLGERMDNAIRDVLGMGYRSCVLTGTDSPQLTCGDIMDAFRCLEERDMVFTPTEDGGYCLVGAGRRCSEAFSLERYSHGRVMEETLERIPGDVTWELLPGTFDIDVPADLERFRALGADDPEGLFTGRSCTMEFARRYPLISAVVPLYNEEEMAESVIRQCRKIRKPREVILVDGCSTDSTLERLREAMSDDDGIRIISSPRGRGAQLNAGAEAAAGEILFFFHGDCQLPDDPAEEIKAVLRDHQWGCFGVRFDSRNFFMYTNRWISNFRARRRHIVFGDQGIFIGKDLFRKVGGFPDLRIMEDLQFSLNLKKMGIPPGMAEHRILASDRRYRGSTAHKLLVMRNMARMRRMYMKGMDTCQGEMEYERLCPDRRNWVEKSKGYRFAKRTLDLVLGVVGLVILSPAIVITAVAVKVRGNGKVFFWQERIGYHGKPVVIWKFRTMEEDAEEIESSLDPEQRREYHEEYRLKEDPRVIPGGDFIRRWGLDELPQLINVLQGRMSIIGPRPILPEETEKYTDEELDRLQSVRPGWMGYWQAYGRDWAGYHDGSRQKMELFYADNASLALDAKIFFKMFTAEAVRKMK